MIIKGGTRSLETIHLSKSFGKLKNMCSFSLISTYSNYECSGLADTEGHSSLQDYNLK